MFRPPTEGYEDPNMAQTLDEYLFPKKSAIHPTEAPVDLHLSGISKGDVLTIEVGRNPHHGAVGLTEYQGDKYLAIWYWHKPLKRWYIETDKGKAWVTDDMRLVGIARTLIIDQLN